MRIAAYKEHSLDQVRQVRGDQLLIANMIVVDGMSDNESLVAAKAGISYTKPDSSGYVMLKNIKFTDHTGGIPFQCVDQRLEMQKAYDGKFFARYGFDVKPVTFGDFTAKGLVEVYDDEGALVEQFVVDGVIRAKTVKKNEWISQF